MSVLVLYNVKTVDDSFDFQSSRTTVGFEGDIVLDMLFYINNRYRTVLLVVFKKLSQHFPYYLAMNELCAVERRHRAFLCLFVLHCEKFFLESLVNSTLNERWVLEHTVND